MSSAKLLFIFLTVVIQRRRLREDVIFDIPAFRHFGKTGEATVQSIPPQLKLTLEH